MKNIFVSSDHHFGHKNILKFQEHTRPFSSIEEHDEALIERHNELVKKEDDVYFLGDFAFRKPPEILHILKRLNGRKHFIFGNHDHNMTKHPNLIVHEFEWMRNYYDLKVGKQHIVLFHFPIFSWDRMHHGALHFYGHTHSSIPTMMEGRGKDVGVDSNDCYPWNVDELIDMMTKCPVVDARNRI